MKYLLFDMAAVSVYVSRNSLQSVEYAQAKRFIEHIRGKLETEQFENTIIEYCEDGIIFSGKNPEGPISSQDKEGHNIFCIDNANCDIIKENDAALLLILQKIFRTALKIWNHMPFSSSSERMSGSKSIVFPFIYPDPRRIVIERSSKLLQLENRGIGFPLFAYNYTKEDAGSEETVKTTVLKLAGKQYSSKYYELQNKLAQVPSQEEKNKDKEAMRLVDANRNVGREDFIYWTYEKQYMNLTESQKEIVDYPKYDSPLRIDGAAGTGKTMSMIMRAYKMLSENKASNMPISIVFFSHSRSTNYRNLLAFSNYEHSENYLKDSSVQHIRFTTLSEYCASVSSISQSSLLEIDAGEAKTYQLMLIEEVVNSELSRKKIKTIKPLLSEEMQEVLDSNRTSPNALYAMLQHEFSVQIKGRTDSTIDKYYELKPIPNGLPCHTKKDKEIVFWLFSQYQEKLEQLGSYDTDDVVLQALSWLNAPIWRRERNEKGYDYIFADEMHLFNVNEQSVFHYLTKSQHQKEIPICFALDYSQAVGNRGDVTSDYSETAFGTPQSKNYKTVFRNSPDITRFCMSIAAAGVLMFDQCFSNPYYETQSSFSQDEERLCEKPSLYLYDSEDDMIQALKNHISRITKELQCKSKDIVIIAFDNNHYCKDGIIRIEKLAGVNLVSLVEHQPDCRKQLSSGEYYIASPYDVNGLEFQAVILLGVDEGTIPQTAGTSDISQHFIKYSAFNLLYLTSSRAKYRLTLLCNRLKGISSCLEHSIESDYLEVKDAN